MHRLLSVLAGMALGGCAVNATGAKCESESNCPPGEGCGLDGRCSPAALCPPAGNAPGEVCTPGVGSPPTCGSGTDLGKLKRCDASPVSRDCYVWNQIDCAASGLYCDDVSGPPKCACFALGGADDVVADAIGGSLLSDPVTTPTGVGTPPVCRFKAVSEALRQTGSGTGHMVVRATGWTGTPVVFSETEPITIPAGVTLSTSDAPLTTTNYVLQAPATGALPFITLAAGATLSGWEVRNQSATADALGTDCGIGTATVVIDTVKVTGTGPGASPAKFKAGIHFSDNLCSLLVNATTIGGVSDTALVLDGGGPSVSLTNNVITGNGAVSLYSFGGGIMRRGGGIVVAGTIPSSFVFHGNQVYGNQGDQILVAAGLGTLDLTGGAMTSDCGLTSNVIRCYDASTSGKGIYAAGLPLEVKVDYNEWPTTFPNKPVDASGNVTGIGSWCAPDGSRPACP